MSPTEKIKAVTPEVIKKYSPKSNIKATIQVLNTLVPYFLLFYLAIESLSISYWLTAIVLFPLSLFIVRIFMIMHDCGHKSLFKTQRYNTIIGFFTGVIVGIPQYVWAQHHNYHHATNGNWEKYRGPLNVKSVEEYKKLSPVAQKKYRYGRSIWLAPVGAFLYFIFNPRFNWMLGSLKFSFAIITKKIKNLKTPLTKLIAEQNTPFWKSRKEYLHMSMNNIVLITSWIAASRYFGTAEFFTVYIISLSFAGAAGLIIFTIQHNFEDSYASDDAHWDYYDGALYGTSFLTFPKVVNWFGADIAYHHIHHMSAGIPNYNLAKCHREYADLFDNVTRIRLRDINKAFKFILWDEANRKMVSIKQYNQMNKTAA